MRQMRNYRTYPMNRMETPQVNVTLDDIRNLSFALRETALYLNNHPCDAEALEYFKKTSCMYDAAKAEYEATNAPITWRATEDCNTWSWVAFPWPWEL